jgi:hypothetical protein
MITSPPAKTSRSTLAPEVFIDVDANTSVRERADKSGSGIDTVQSFSCVKPGDLDLWAPRGIVNAGDGNLYIAAVEVLGYGGANELDQNKPRKDDIEGRRTQDPSSAVQVIGAGPLTEQEKASLTEDERRKLAGR